MGSPLKIDPYCDLQRLHKSSGLRVDPAIDAGDINAPASPPQDSPRKPFRINPRSSWSADCSVKATSDMTPDSYSPHDSLVKAESSKDAELDTETARQHSNDEASESNGRDTCGINGVRKMVPCFTRDDSLK